MNPRNEVEGGDTGRRITPENGLITNRGGDMGFPKPCVSDEDQVGGIFDPGGVDEGQDVVFADLRIEIPVKLLQRLDMLDARQSQESFDLKLPSVFNFLFKETNHHLPLIGGNLLDRGFAGQFFKQGFQIIHHRPPILWVDKRY
jgi:hypothetical protein